MKLVERVAHLFPNRIIYKTPEDEAGEKPYLHRFYLFPFWGRNSDEARTFPLAIYLHHICMSDMDRHLHDHPWAFLSIILDGGYTEEVPHKTKGLPELSRNVRRRFSVALRKATALHRVRLHGDEEPIWSLVFAGPRIREWGYQTEDGWVDEKTYWSSEQR